MTIKVNYIQGNRGSVCNNDAYAVVDGTKLLTIIPASTLNSHGLTGDDLKKAFIQAAEKVADVPEAKRHARQEVYARKILGL